MDVLDDRSREHPPARCTIPPSSGCGYARSRAASSFDERLWWATTTRRSPVTCITVPKVASQRRVALARIVAKTGLSVFWANC